jgi:hypothetical protein
MAERADDLFSEARQHAAHAYSDQTLALVVALRGVAAVIEEATEALHQLRTAYERTHE